MLVDLTNVEPLLDPTLFPDHVVVAAREHSPDHRTNFWHGLGRTDPFAAIDRERERNEHDWLVFYLLKKPSTPHWAVSFPPDGSLLTYEVETVQDLKKRFWLLRAGRRGGPYYLRVRLPTYRPDADEPPNVTRKHVARLLRP